MRAVSYTSKCDSLAEIMRLFVRSRSTVQVNYSTSCSSLVLKGAVYTSPGLLVNPSQPRPLIISKLLYLLLWHTLSKQSGYALSQYTRLKRLYSCEAYTQSSKAGERFLDKLDHNWVYRSVAAFSTSTSRLETIF